MKILVCPADEGGCGNYRLRWPALTLAEHGVRVIERGDKFVTGKFNADDELVGIEPLDADVVVIQRPLMANLVAAIPMFQAQGTAVVVEMDDDFHRIDPRNPAYIAANPEERADRNWRHLERACQLADLVTCTTPALAKRYGAHGRVAVLPNCIPQSYLEEPSVRALAGREWRPGQKVRVGWAGSVDTHPGDLESTQGGVLRAMRATRGFSTFHVIGTGKHVRQALTLDDEPTHTGWVPLDNYPRALSALDVGIVPLRACQFNRAKSWLKGLEMAAVGVPFVASATPDYERLAKLGAGFLAGRSQDWQRLLVNLIRDSGLRTECAARGREVAKAHTIEGNKHLWLSAWTEAAVIRKAA